MKKKQMLQFVNKKILHKLIAGKKLNEKEKTKNIHTA